MSARYVTRVTWASAAFVLPSPLDHVEHLHHKQVCLEHPKINKARPLLVERPHRGCAGHVWHGSVDEHARNIGHIAQPVDASESAPGDLSTHVTNLSRPANDSRFVSEIHA